MSYQIDAACRKHKTHHNIICLAIKEQGWTISPDREILKISKRFETVTDAKMGKVKLQSELYKIERQIKPFPTYGMIFTNAYWVQNV